MVAFKSRLVLAAILLGGTPALAADLPPPPPPPLEPVPVAIGSGWYLRADFTESFYGRPSDNTRPDPNDPNMPPLVGLRLSEASGGGGGVGYRINEWLRIDATIDTRGPGKYRAFSSRSNFESGYNIEAAHVSALTGLVNVYADLGTWWGLTPYIGAGVGFADIGLSRAYTQTTCVLDSCDGIAGTGPRDVVRRPGRSVTGLAWALTGGVSYALGGGFSLDAAYRYVDFGVAKSGLDAFGGGTRVKDITANEVRVGLRYDLGGGFGGQGFAALPSLGGGNPYGN